MNKLSFFSGRLALTHKCGLVIAGLLMVQVPFLLGQPQTMPPELPLPPDYKLAEAAAANVSQSKTIAPDAKELVQGRFQTIKSEFGQIWAPLQDTYAQYLKGMRELDKEKTDYTKAVEGHDKKPHDFTPEQAAEIRAYNNEKDSFKKQKESILAKRERIDKDYKEAWAKNAKPLDEWRSKSLRPFNDVAQGLLDGKLQFTKGLAWSQLVEAAKSDKKANVTFDGGEKPSSDAVNAQAGPSSLPKPVDQAIAGVYAEAPPGVSDRVRKGFQAIMTRDWKVAKAWFEDALNRDPSNVNLRRLVALADYSRDPGQTKQLTESDKALLRALDKAADEGFNEQLLQLLNPRPPKTSAPGTSPKRN